MQIKAANADEYLNLVPEDRREPLRKLRETILHSLPEGFAETQEYHMISYVVPHSIYPAGYHCNPNVPLPFMSIASQKNFIALYHMGMYADPNFLDWFVQEWPRHSKWRLDMGKSCIRFKKPEQIPYELMAKLAARMSVQEWILLYEKNLNRQ